ncbi:MAG: tetratricopeptide repeat protein [Dorea sp.]|jgi:tetratricopeptide (TPR) repeat protein|nr:tetratricopeptide repeat protein [Dorea sp.]
MKRIQLYISVFLMAAMLTGCITNPYKSGMEALSDGQYEEAARQFKEAVKKEQNKADSYRGLGLALWETKDYEKAKEALENAVKEGSKKTGTIYNLLGSCELQAGNMKEAIAYFEEGLKMDGNDEELTQAMRFNCIFAYEKLGDVETAKRLVKEYTADYPEDESAAKEAQFLETR